jgi:hypothetical protein
MAILKSADGKFYDVPDSQLESLEIPADQVKQRLAEAGGGGPASGPGPGPGPGRGGRAPQVLIQVFGSRAGGFAQTGAPAATAQACESEVEPYHGHGGGHHCHHCHRCHRCHRCHHCFW